MASSLFPVRPEAYISHSQTEAWIQSQRVVVWGVVTCRPEILSSVSVQHLRGAKFYLKRLTHCHPDGQPECCHQRNTVCIPACGTHRPPLFLGKLCCVWRWLTVTMEQNCVASRRRKMQKASPGQNPERCILKHPTVDRIPLRMNWSKTSKC